MAEYVPFVRNEKRCPVSAVLHETKEGFTLTLQASVHFADRRGEKDGMSFRQNKNRALAGFRSWSGKYLLRSGKTLCVRVILRETKKRRGALQVTFLDYGTLKAAETFAGRGKTGMKLRRALRTPGFTFAGLRAEKWRPWKGRWIGLRTDMEMFSVEEISRHEFGHILGLGDMYRDPVMGLKGISGNVAELYADFADKGGRCRAVMDSNGPVTPLDAEMMLLAQMTGRFQQYQKQKGRGNVSAVLREAAEHEDQRIPG